MDMYGKWDEKVLRVLEEDCTSNGFDIKDANLLECLTKAETLYEENLGESRWWTNLLRVVKVGEHFLGYEWANVTGDKGLSDTGWEFDRASVDFYKPVEVKVTRYVLKLDDVL